MIFELQLMSRSQKKKIFFKFSVYLLQYSMVHMCTIVPQRKISRKTSNYAYQYANVLNRLTTDTP